MKKMISVFLMIVLIVTLLSTTAFAEAVISSKCDVPFWAQQLGFFEAYVNEDGTLGGVANANRKENTLLITLIADATLTNNLEVGHADDDKYYCEAISDWDTYGLNSYVVLDLNGHTLNVGTHKLMVINDGTLTIMDSAATKGHIIGTAGNRFIQVKDNGSLVIDASLLSNDVNTFLLQGFVLPGGNTDAIIAGITQAKPIITADMINGESLAFIAGTQPEAVSALAEAVNNGTATVDVSIESATPTDLEKNAVDHAVGNTDSSLTMYLDIDMTVSNDTYSAQLSQAGKPITVSVNLTSAIQDALNSGNKTVNVVRYHNGIAQVLPTTLSADKKQVTFASDQFSLYAVVVSTVEHHHYTPTSNVVSSAQTSDIGMALYAGMAMMSIAGIGWTLKTKSKNGNHTNQ